MAQLWRETAVANHTTPQLLGGAVDLGMGSTTEVPAAEAKRYNEMEEYFNGLNFSAEGMTPAGGGGWLTAADNTNNEIGGFGAGLANTGSFRFTKGGSWSPHYYASNWTGGSRAGIVTYSAIKYGKVIGRYSTYTSLAIGVVSVGDAWVNDGYSYGDKTQLAVAKTSLGITGAWAGAEIGAATGATIGAFFGGVGVVPGAIFGAILGGGLSAAAGGLIGGAYSYYRTGDFGQGFTSGAITGGLTGAASGGYKGYMNAQAAGFNAWTGGMTCDQRSIWKMKKAGLIDARGAVERFHPDAYNAAGRPDVDEAQLNRTIYDTKTNEPTGEARVSGGVKVYDSSTGEALTVYGASSRSGGIRCCITMNNGLNGKGFIMTSLHELKPVELYMNGSMHYMYNMISTMSTPTHYKGIRRNWISEGLVIYTER